MMRALFEDGLALGVIAAGFRASEEEVGYVMEHPPVKPEPHDEIERLQALPYGVYLKTRHWLQVRDEALARADHRCALDNSTELLQVHHRTYDRRGCERPADVIVLCDPCHTRHHAQLRVA
jgi:5-methylcytosine-specific restriction endonuclease McrA